MVGDRQTSNLYSMSDPAISSASGIADSTNSVAAMVHIDCSSDVKSEPDDSVTHPEYQEDPLAIKTEPTDEEAGI